MKLSLALALVLGATPGRAQSARDLLRSSDYVSANQVRMGDQILLVDRLTPPRGARRGPGRSGPTAAAGFWHYGGVRWPGGVLPLAFAREVPESEARMLLDACADWTRRSGVRCVRRSNENAYAVVMRGDGCYATVGYHAGAQNMISIGPGCADTGVMLHELGHAFGIMHEHQRPDRDEYLVVNWENIQPTSEALGAYTVIGADYDGAGAICTAYDFDSIMHYGAGFFSANGLPTFELRPRYAAYVNRVGRQVSLSRFDAACMAGLYSAARTPPPQDAPPPPEAGEENEALESGDGG